MSLGTRRGLCLALLFALVSCAPSAPSPAPVAPSPSPSLEHVLGTQAPWPLVEPTLRTLLQRRSERFSLLLPAEGEAFRCEVDGPAATLTCDGVAQRFDSVEAMVGAVAAGQVHQALTVARLLDVPTLQARGLPLVPDGALQRSEELVEWWVDWLDERGREEQEAPLRVQVQVRVRARGAIEASVLTDGQKQALEASSVVGLVRALQGALSEQAAHRAERQRGESLDRLLAPMLALLSKSDAPLAYGDLVIGTPLRRLPHRFEKMSTLNRWVSVDGRDQVLSYFCLDCAQGKMVESLEGKLASVFHHEQIALGSHEAPSFQRRCEALRAYLQQKLGPSLEDKEGSPCHWTLRRAQGRVDLGLDGDTFAIRLESHASLEATQRRERARACARCRLIRPGQHFYDVGTVVSIDHKACTMKIEASGPGVSQAGRDGEISVEPCRDEP